MGAAATAVAVIGIADLLRWGFPWIFADTPYLAYFPAVATAAMVAGFYSGLLASLLAVFSVSMFFDSTPWQFDVDAIEITRRATFLAGGLIISAMAQRLRSAMTERSHLAAVLEHSGEAILSKDLDGTICSWNPAAEDVLGYGSDEIVGRNVRCLVPEELGHEEQMILSSVRDGRRVENLETVRLAKDGRRVDVLATISPLRNDSGRVVGAATILRDISERKATEAALRYSERRYRVLFESMDEAFCIVEVLFDENEKAVDYRFIEVNPAFGKHTGIREALGKTIRQLRDGLTSDVWIEAYGRVALTGEPTRLVAESPYAKRWFDVFAFRFGLPESRQVAILFSDVTERKETEMKLRLQAEALEAAANGIVITNAEGRILWANRAFAHITGYSLEEVVGRKPSILKSGQQDEAFYRRMWETIRHGQAWQGELVNRRRDGSFYHEEMTITPLRDEDGKIAHFIAIKQNISERKARESQLADARTSAERAKAAAEEASRAKDHFLAVLSHELRTPLTAVLPALQMLQSMLNGQESGRELLEMARRNVEVEARLIDDLLDVTRITRGKLELNRQAVPLCTIVQHAVQVCMPDIEARQLHFDMKVESGPHLIDADAARLQQVFWNLIKNAVKFTPQDGCVGVRIYRDGGHAIVEVADSGVGIEPHAIGRIFNAFEQAGATRQFGGLGLGLAISKALVDLHGGEVCAHSDGRGKGAKFVVKLPLASSDAAEMTGEASTRATPLPKASLGLDILLVEDHGDTAQVLRRVLQMHGHRVVHAGDVASALRHAQEQPFDLILSDLGLPDGSGVDLLRQLRVRRIATPAIALSGYGQEQDLARSREAGFLHHLVKPVTPEQLTAAIYAAMTRVRPDP